MPHPDFSPAADRNKQPILDVLRQHAAHRTVGDLRRVDARQRPALGAGLGLSARHAMPANNLLLVWARRPTGNPPP